MTLYRWREQSARCREEWEAAEEEAADVLRKEARRRAVDGVSEPVFFQGKICGYVQKFSDTLLGRLLVAHCEEHKQESTVNLQGSKGAPLVVEHTVPADNARDVAEIIAEVLAPEGPAE